MTHDQTTPAPVEVTQLKPCPFCGTVPICDWRSASPIEGPDEGYWDITCCRAFAHEDTKAEAIAAWNTRHSAPAGEVEPVAWLVRHEMHGTEVTTQKCTDADKAYGWTETPLYAGKLGVNPCKNCGFLPDSVD